MKKSILTLIIVITSVFSLCAQSRIIKGRVISEFYEILPGVSIMVDNVEVGKTDLNGFYTINIPVPADKVVFQFVGMETTPMQLSEGCDEVDVVMMSATTYDFISLKKIDRLRMRRFKELPKVHREAFKKGMFKTEEAFYTQEFVPYGKGN